MGITLYTAPDCMRCKIVKAYLGDNGIPFETVDFKADADIFNKFYRENRKAIYRNPEGVEFPLFQDGEIIRQGSGEVLAWLLGQGALDVCVTRSDLLHGKISGLYPSRCPDGQEDNFVALVERLCAGGLEVWLQVDGRKPALLGKLLAIPGTHAWLDIVGGADAMREIFGAAPGLEDLARTLELVNACDGGGARFLAVPLPEVGGWAWPERDDAAAGAKMLEDAGAKPTMPFYISPLPEQLYWDRHGLEPITDQQLIALRNGARKYLFRAEIRK